MLILNDNHRLRAGVASMIEQCPYCAHPFNEYPLIMSDNTQQTVFHVACAIELATEIMVDLYTFFSPPVPYTRLFVLSAPEAPPDASQECEGAPTTWR